MLFVYLYIDRVGLHYPLINWGQFTINGKLDSILKRNRCRSNIE